VGILSCVLNRMYRLLFSSNSFHCLFLKEDLIVDIVIRYRIRGDKTHYDNFSNKLNLKKPLIAKLNLWKKKSNEPMEHVDEMESASLSSSLKN